MAYEKEVFIPVQSSIYAADDNSERLLRIAYSIPSAGMNDETGILCLLPGYGGRINSNVYHKMRQQFSDEHNLVVLQCDYFGIQYMAINHEELEKYTKKSEQNAEKNVMSIELNESWTDCNDMGFMQAMDVIAMVLWFIRKAFHEALPFNSEKIIAYGSSHGCYLSYLINRICPGLLKLIIDNSAYIYPVWLNSRRCVRKNTENGSFYKKIAYLVMREPHMRLPIEFYNLLTLYEGFQNNCRIISFHGSEDIMVSIQEKEMLVNRIGKKAALFPIYPCDVDGNIFKNAEHGLGIDLLKLYEFVEPVFHFNKSKNFQFPDPVLIDGKHDTLEITYEKEYPQLQWKKKEN